MTIISPQATRTVTRRYLDLYVPYSSTPIISETLNEGDWLEPADITQATDGIITIHSADSAVPHPISGTVTEYRKNKRVIFLGHVLAVHYREETREEPIPLNEMKPLTVA